MIKMLISTVDSTLSHILWYHFNPQTFCYSTIQMISRLIITQQPISSPAIVSVLYIENQTVSSSQFTSTPLWAWCTVTSLSGEDVLAQCIVHFVLVKMLLCRCGGPRFDQSRIRMRVTAFICSDALWRSGNGIRHARAEIRLNEHGASACKRQQSPSWSEFVLALVTAQPAVTPFNIVTCSTRSVSVFGDGGRIYGIYVMREGIFDSRIASPRNQQTSERRGRQGDEGWKVWGRR